MVKRALRVTHSNPPIADPITIEVTVGGTVIAIANPARLSITLQNNGTEPCLIRLGGNPSITAYNMVLGADSGIRKGCGGNAVITEYCGEIKGITEANTTVISVTEELSTV